MHISFEKSYSYFGSIFKLFPSAEIEIWHL